MAPSESHGGVIGVVIEVESDLNEVVAKPTARATRSRNLADRLSHAGLCRAPGLVAPSRA
jgi:uncharacterized membrane protein YqgA involved in biofilm formation